MVQLFTDDYTLLRFAKALKARQAVLDEGGSVEDAEAAFRASKDIYDPENPILAGHLEGEPFATLRDQPNLLNLLIEYLEFELHTVRPLQAELAKAKGWFARKRAADLTTKLAPVLEERERLWERYEVMRRLAAFEVRCLEVTRA